MPLIRQNQSVGCRDVPVIYHYLLFSYGHGERVDDLLRDALIKWRVRCCMVVKNIHLMSQLMRCHVLFLMVWRVSSHGAWRRYGGWLDSPPFLSPACKLHDRPSILWLFYFIPLCFNHVLRSEFLLCNFWFISIVSFYWNWLYVMFSFQSLFF